METQQAPASADNDKQLAVHAATQIVVAGIARGGTPMGGGGPLFAEIYSAISAAIAGKPEVPAPPAQEPAVNPKKSVHDDFIICLEDGKKFKSLKRHIMTHFGLTPEEYRKKWQLAPDYPMVAPTYALQRSQLAKDMGLGRKPGQKRGGRRKAA